MRSNTPTIENVSMSYNYYHFRPNLQGTFLKRFQLAVQKLCKLSDPSTEVEKIAIEEFQWATDEIQINPKQTPDLPSSMVTAPRSIEGRMGLSLAQWKRGNSFSNAA